MFAKIHRRENHALEDHGYLERVRPMGPFGFNWVGTFGMHIVLKIGRLDGPISNWKSSGFFCMFCSIGMACSGMFWHVLA